MASEKVITLDKKFNALINLLALVGADKLGVDDKDRAAYIAIARNPLYRDLNGAIVSSCELIMAHLDTLKTFIKQ